MAGFDELKTLHTALIDARNGYDEAIKDATEAGLRAVFEKVRGLHLKAHEAVHALLRSQGEKPDDSGSFMSTVHETVIGVRSALVGLDRGSLSAFANGEEHTIRKYDDAMAAVPAAATELRGHKDALEAAVGEMKRMSP